VRQQALDQLGEDSPTVAANWDMEAATGEVDMEDDIIVIDDD
jgi:hypothetical protein